MNNIEMNEKGSSDDNTIAEDKRNQNELIENDIPVPQGKLSEKISEKPIEIEYPGQENEVPVEGSTTRKNPLDYDENGKKMGKAKKFVNQKLKVPPRLFKTFIVTSILALLGVVLIILGCIEQIADKTPGRGIMFWVLGAIVIIPGGFYSYQFYKAKRAKNEFQRDDIFEDIPEL